MGYLKTLWNKAYVPTEEQQKLVESIYERSTDKEREALIKMGGHMYAEGWKDYAIPFALVGGAIGYIISRVTR